MKTNWNLLTLVYLVNLFCWTTNKVIVYLFALTCQQLFNYSIFFAIKYRTISFKLTMQWAVEHQ